MNSASATINAMSPQRPASEKTARISLTASRNTQPSATATPLQSSAPIVSNSAKLQSRVRTIPAMLVATAANPGTNLATTSDGGPQRS